MNSRHHFNYMFVNAGIYIVGFTFKCGLEGVQIFNEPRSQTKDRAHETGTSAHYAEIVKLWTQ